jgi:hypothetical protein
MATALKVVPAPPEPAECEHIAFNPYETTGGGLDPSITIKGRCMDCDCWFRQEIDLTTQLVEFVALDSAEIAELRRSVWL